MEIEGIENLLEITSGDKVAQANETIAVVKAIQAAEILSDYGFEKEAELVINTLKDGIRKEASDENAEAIIEVTG